MDMREKSFLEKNKLISELNGPALLATIQIGEF